MPVTSAVAEGPSCLSLFTLFSEEPPVGGGANTRLTGSPLLLGREYHFLQARILDVQTTMTF